MEFIYKVEIVGKVCILSRETEGKTRRIAAGTPKMCSDGLKVDLSNEIAQIQEEKES